MRKISPAGVRDDFLNQLAQLTSFYSVGFPAFTTESQRSIFTEHSLLAAAVAWEGFVSDLFIAYINQDSTEFKAHLSASLSEHIKSSSKSNMIFGKYGNISLPRHLKKSDIESLVDDSGSNITFTNYAALAQKAEKWLVPNHASVFTNIAEPQKSTIDALISLRNHIAHRSERSSIAMNLSLAKGALHGTRLKRGANNVTNVGAWLKAVPAQGSPTRFNIIIDTLRIIANRVV